MVRRLPMLRENLPRYAFDCLKIQEKSGALVPLAFNRAQMVRHRMMEDQKKRTIQ